MFGLCLGYVSPLADPAVDSSRSLCHVSPMFGVCLVTFHRLLAELDTMQSANVHGLVLLTHIPPFVGSAEEPTGWGNWPTDVRHTLLTPLTRPSQLPCKFGKFGALPGSYSSLEGGTARALEGQAP